MSASLASPFQAAIKALAADQPAVAVPLLRQAVETGEGGALAGLNLGMALMAMGRFTEAEPHLQAATIALPSVPEPFVRLGVIAATRGETQRAADYCSAALLHNPTHIPALAALASIEEGAGRLDRAAELIEEARLLDPAEPELTLSAGRLALARGQFSQATDRARSVLAGNPSHVQAARIFAAAILQATTATAALALIDDCAAAAPLSPAWALVKAFALLQGGDPHGALAELRAAAAIVPESAEIQAELGRLLAYLNRTEEAEVALRLALASKPSDLDLQNLLSTLLWKRHRYGEMVAILENAIAQFGSQPTLNMNLALVLNAQGRQDEAMRAADSAVVQSRGGLGPLVNRIGIMPYHPVSGRAADLLSAGRDIAARLPAVPALAPSARRPKSRLRIGILSGGLGVHPVGWLTLAALEALPEEKFDLAAYSLKSRRDTLNDRFRARASIWRDVTEPDDAALATVIAADQVDILMDLGGYGEGGRPFVLNYRPAPVQVKWVGSQFSTTGLPCVDWMITDRWETPEGFERHYSEKLLRLPDGYICYLPPIYAPDPGPLPALKNGHVTFGCFNNLTKMTPEVLSTWAALLRRHPTARFIIRTHALADGATLRLTQARVEAAGMPLDRVELLGGVPHRELLESYRRIDVALDPFPYTGGLTVCEALWMGVPVVSLVGDSFAARHAFSHLNNIGMPDWVVNDPQAYVDRASEAVADLDSLSRLRAGLRARAAASPLCDAPRFGRNMARALRGIWEQG